MDDLTRPQGSLAAPTRKSAPYIFLGQTTSLCETCHKLVPAKILREGDNVFYQKRCREHGVQKTLVSSDADYYLLARDYLKPGDWPLEPQTKTDYGCPFDCGLCPDHEQHSCLAIIEVNEECDLTCPVCFADSSPKKSLNRSLDDIEKMLDTLVASEGEPDLLQISGGEPTLHPKILQILEMAMVRPIRHVMINSNGLRIARDEVFVAELAKFKPGFEVYLQFDSLKRQALMDLRGADLRRVRQQALENLDKHNISTTLVVTMKKGVNDDEVGDIIGHALKWNCVRGVTFQPVQDAGRNEGFDAKIDRLLLSDIRRAIINSDCGFEAGDMIPLPCNPESISIGYALRNGENIAPITGFVPRDVIVADVPNAVTFEKYPELREKMFEFFSLSTTPGVSAERLEALLCCLPQVETPDDIGYDNLFRVAISEFLDPYNFCIARVKRSCVHFVTADGEIIPFDTYNLFYRDGRIEKRRRDR
ncbi:MAG TPA: radical SAM protein [Rhizobiales bacterium]|nr:radical SAM protein [Hyphomicrobiales bacterium]